MTNDEKEVLSRYRKAFTKALDVVPIPLWGSVGNPWKHHSDQVISRMCQFLKYSAKHEARVLKQTQGSPMGRFCRILRSEEALIIDRFVVSTVRK